jgi:hypothetical protein
MLPAWQLSLGTNLETQVGYDVDPSGGGISTLYDANNRSGFPTFSQYFLALYPSPELYHLTQSGDVPTDARSIHFIVYSSAIELRINGSLVPVTYDAARLPPQSGVDFHRYANGSADITAFAGQIVQLELSNIDPSTPTGVDTIFFSPIPIPEPSVVALLSLGVVLLIRRRGR